MTVTTTNSATEYTGDGSTTSFQGTFPSLSPNYITATVDDVVVARTLTGDTTQPFLWNAVITPAPPLNSVVVLSRATPPTQLTDYTPYGRYQAEQIESDLDRLTMVTQEIEGGTSGGSVDQIAATVPFAPTATISSTNVQDAIEEVEQDVINVSGSLSGKADKTTRIVTSNSSTLQITNPTLADDVNLTILTNQPNGVAGLDSAGKIALSAFPLTTLVFVGFWDPTVQGSTPPALGTAGNFYIFEKAGNMTLREASNTVPHTVAVLQQDYMIYADLNNTTGSPAGWYYVARVTPPVSAAEVSVNPPIVGLAAANVYDALVELLGDISGITVAANQVSFTPTGTILATNVQAAIAELDAEISVRFKDVGAQINITRQDATVVLASTTSGGTLRDGAGATKASWSTTDGMTSGISQSNNVAAFTRKDYVDAQIAAIPAPLSPLAGCRTTALGVVSNQVNAARVISCAKGTAGVYNYTLPAGTNIKLVQVQIDVGAPAGTPMPGSTVTAQGTLTFTVTTWDGTGNVVNYPHNVVVW